ncbi:hypothetical protein SARC_02467 [Sphaeroforma arctica JP610]|uniref:Uncharacterized protein n=1 Tax=Sphaeroforma arctica JP610 TaxID=667725 RepID=A0A0L0G8Z0_9EUKA|nr:hypothetical protein SARC_02467 [Sphaeroforma arctica JP610]KNC85346.1 hypothetical protein SARC_02467 [Sphaeroforma arctica JP610]|eukprot:XP_014159248.1 hypothetical protein SARC_02467 [Sphaeroforma arctica JP610]
MKNLTALVALALIMNPHSTVSGDSVQNDADIEQNLALIKHIEGDLAIVFNDLSESFEGDGGVNEERKQDRERIRQIAKVMAEDKFQDGRDIIIQSFPNGFAYGGKRGVTDRPSEINVVENKGVVDKDVGFDTSTSSDEKKGNKAIEEVVNSNEGVDRDAKFNSTAKLGENPSVTGGVNDRKFKFESVGDGDKAFDNKKTGEIQDSDKSEEFVNDEQVSGRANHNAQYADEAQGNDEEDTDQLNLANSEPELNVDRLKELVLEDPNVANEPNEHNEPVEKIERNEPNDPYARHHIFEDKTREEAEAAAFKVYTKGGVIYEMREESESDEYDELGGSFDVIGGRFTGDTDMDMKMNVNSVRQHLTVHGVDSGDDGDFQGDFFSESLAISSFILSIALMLSIAYTIISRSAQRRVCTSRPHMGNKDLESGGRRFSLK